MQNHGFAIDTKTLSGGWKELFYNANDKTNEGIYHETLPFFSVQFHPEAKGGPTETGYLFDHFIHLATCRRTGNHVPFEHPLATKHTPPANLVAKTVSKVLVLGSGGLSIGQAGEFDYSGSQAIKALKEENVATVLINPNIATVQTTKGLADSVYFLPVTPEFVKKVIELEKPDGLFLQFGGQTALNCGISLYREGYFEKMGVSILGTPVDVILATEDRELFSEKLQEIDEKIAPSISARTMADALAAANKIGYPVIVRAGFALGGLGSGFAYNDKELTDIVTLAFSTSEMVLVERSLKGWKEIEYEVVRDREDNCVTVCNMENFDPLGIHTGESIVVAPSQTLSDRTYHMLREVSIRVVRHLGIVGECNIQFSLDPHSETYYIIEVNARLSRSSALASKATGYPLAFIAAKLAQGKTLPELRNLVTGGLTTACFEPSLDYVVVKMPRWDLNKFVHVERTIGTSMKSVGEVMAVGRTFEEAIQKTIRMVHNKFNGFESGRVEATEDGLVNASYQRILVIADAFAKGYTVEQIRELTRIDTWFLTKLKKISDLEVGLKKIKTAELLTAAKILEAKKLGFSDAQIARCLHTTDLAIRTLRQQHNIIPVVKQIDTVSAEFPAANNYLYLTYNGTEDDVPRKQKGDAESIIVLGSGCYSIGSSVEFDWCAVSCIRTLGKLGYKRIVINFNPETVSTDYDECDELYFEEISFETVTDIYERKLPMGVVISMGGQLAQNIAMALSRQNIHVLGTDVESIDNAENRYKFSRMLDTLNVDQPKWKECKTLADTKEFCKTVGYPCLVRPSFVLSGAGMTVVNTDAELETYLKEALLDQDVNVVISKFITEAKEIDVDAVAQNGNLIVYAVSEHIENAGVHSGDATLVFPAQDLDEKTVTAVTTITAQIARQLNVTGPMNIQFIAKKGEIKVIECNLRASRSFPFVSKTSGVNFAEIATQVLVGKKQLEPISLDMSLHKVAVKVPQFSFGRLAGADPVLGVEMASTGEVACFATNKYEAYIKGLLSTGFKMPEPGAKVLISIGSFAEKQEFLPSARKLKEMGYVLFGTTGTADFFTESGVPTIALELPGKTESTFSSEFDLEDQLSTNQISLCILLPSKNKYRRPSSFMSIGYMTRRMAVDFDVPLITNIKCAKTFVDALRVVPKDLQIGAMDCLSSRQLCHLPSLVDTSIQHVRSGAWTKVSKNVLSSGCTVALVTSSFAEGPTTSSSLFKECELLQAEATVDGCCPYGLLVSLEHLPPFNKQVASNTCGVSFDSFDSLERWIEAEDAADQGSENGKSVENWRSYLTANSLPICLPASGHSTVAACITYALVHSFHVHVTSITNARDLALIRKAKAQNIKVTCQVTAAELFRNNKLFEFIDVIDVIGVSQQVSEDGPDSPHALSFLLNAVNDGLLPFDTLVEKLHTNPFKIFNLAERPEDHVEVDMARHWSFTPKGEEKQTGVGSIFRVIVDGKVAYIDGKVIANPSSHHTGINIVVPHEYTSTVATSPVKATLVPPFAEESTRHQSPMRSSNSSQTSARALTPVRTREAASRQTSTFPLPVPLPLPKTPTGLFHILSVKQVDRNQLHNIFAVAAEMKTMVQRMGRLDILKNHVLALVFLEPSTRTMGSFEAAMLRLGGAVVSVSGDTSSVKKGESLEDTVRTVEQYADAVVLRAPGIGSAFNCSTVIRKPIINAGDGAGEHPTQAMLDTYTIRQELGTNHGLTVTFVGDLKYGRTVHSLVQMLALYNNMTFIYVSPEELKLPRAIYESLEKQGIRQYSYTTHEGLEEAFKISDVVYVTRIQKERFEDLSLYESVAGIFKVTPELMALAKEKMCLLHPLPRVDEISILVDSDPRAAYFRQMENGMYVRMALLAMVLGKV
eukprot:TRINITY_DN879_c0_g1_i2.p1 TRINITY_DN879_c0_g1~~TRINITY_DN879_c0_g1_i2.p1  ORF type:complete len:2180 (-),score=570.05 TRINITY_DN879_c0_g1_i2:157-5766(-)